jgi:predicted RNA-binding Zn ribbon-like protein
MSPTHPPRYDLPNVAPEPLRLVQRFVNTINLETGEDWLPSWLEEEGVPEPTAPELARARALREAIRDLLYENNRQRAGSDPRITLTAAADDARLSIDFSEEPRLVSRASGVDAVVGRVLAATFLATLDGTWKRLKACRNHDCRWSFYDYSKNRSASWCSMQLCGNRTKTRAYRARRSGR